MSVLVSPVVAVAWCCSRALRILPSAQAFNAPRAVLHRPIHPVRRHQKAAPLVRLATVQSLPDFTVLGDDNDDNNSGAERTNGDDSSISAPFDDRRSAKSESDDFYNDNSEEGQSTEEPYAGRRRSPVRSGKFVDSGSSWMQRNRAFSPSDDNAEGRGGRESFGAPRPRRDDWSSNRRSRDDRPPRDGQRYGSRDRPRYGSRDGPGYSSRGEERPVRTFRQDFRGTRVFVQGLPPDATWQDLKDHFREVVGKNSVVFASVSSDRETGESKCCGVVQFETTEMAATAIAIASNHLLNGNQLRVREDMQDDRSDRQLSSREPVKKGPTPPTKWVCADETNSFSLLSEDDIKAVRSMIKARDDARRRRQYEASDNLRNELKFGYGVHLDDRLQMWWVSTDGQVPSSVQEQKGEGRWGAPPAWRQIPTTPENDACVNPDLVNGLLKQRDIARREKDFATADRLLEQARTSPDGDLNLRIHDESRTWRIWTEESPFRPPQQQQQSFLEQRKQMSPGDQCIAIVEEFAPDRVEEIQLLLTKFEGREYQILKNLKKRYVDVE
jgi:RNA recognition motif. (a.k.a. RRM, RBD, or RNP domain)